MGSIKELENLLRIVEGSIDKDHCRSVDDRYRAALTCGHVDRPPLVALAEFGFDSWKLPHPWDRFRLYSYKESFYDPAAMLQNQILTMVVPGLILKDDNPLAVRNNHGTIQIASLLGAKWALYNENSPWAEHFGSLDEIRKLTSEEGRIDVENGIIGRSIETLKFYREILSGYPVCREALQISIPDLEGPVNTAEQLWGSSIYYAFYDDAELLCKLFEMISETMLWAYEQYRGHTYDRLDPYANTQHFYQFPGRLLIRDDSAIMVSQEHYERYIMPYDAFLLKEIGGGSIHFCGNGEHLVRSMLQIPDLAGLDLGQSQKMDIKKIYNACMERKKAVTHIALPREDYISGRAVSEYPTGIVFVYYTKDVEDAKEVVDGYKRHGRI